MRTALASLPRNWALSSIAVAAIAASLWAAAAFLIPMLMSVVLAVVLWPAMLAVQRWLPVRALAALLVVTIAAVASAALAGSVMVQISATGERMPDALRQLARDIARLPASPALSVQHTRSALDELDKSVARMTGTPRSTGPTRADDASASVVGTAVAWAKDKALSASSAAFGVLLQCGVIAMLCFFILCGGEKLTAQAQALCQRQAGRAGQCAPALRECAQQIRRFAGVTVAVNFLFGACVMLGFLALGIPNAALWGLAAMALHFVPYAGLGVMLVLAAVQAYVVHDSVLVALLAAGYVAALGIVVGTLVTVALQGRAAKVDSAPLFAGTVFWSVLWGAWGLVLGPLMVVLLKLVWLESERLGVKPGREPQTESAVGALQASPGIEDTETSPAGAAQQGSTAEPDRFALPAINVSTVAMPLPTS